MDKVDKMLRPLEAAGLKLDLKNCQVAAKKIECLRFVMTTGEVVELDPPMSNPSRFGKHRQMCERYTASWHSRILQKLQGGSCRHFCSTDTAQKAFNAFKTWFTTASLLGGWEESRGRSAGSRLHRLCYTSLSLTN